VLSLKKSFRHIHFLGAEGIGMSALIKILEAKKSLGLESSDMKISRSDISYKKNDALEEDIDLVVFSTAISKNDPEYLELKNRGVMFWHRSDMLQHLASFHKEIVVSGTHGKTTCSAMISHILLENHLDPSFAVGGLILEAGTSKKGFNARAGRGEYFVLEGDESDKSFMKSNPFVALVTSVEADHLENYPGGLEEIKNCFYEFLNKAEYRVICSDNDLLKSYYDNLDEEKKSKTLCYKTSDVPDELLLKMPGEHNRLNAWAASLVTNLLGISYKESFKALNSFQGIKRRFELINDSYQSPQGAKNILVFDDYAHHPSELKTLQDSVMKLYPERKMLLIYQPHHPERTKQFWDDFKSVINSIPEPHRVLLIDIYIARSKPIEAVTSKKMVAEINKANIQYLSSNSSENLHDGLGNDTEIGKKLKPFIDELLRDNDLLMIVGAGSIYKLANEFKGTIE
jgi:UDP-N-acetylmuramate--alanine ligase